MRYPKASETSTAFTDAEIDRLRLHPDNMTQALYLEICFTDAYLREKNEDIEKRIHSDGSHVCDSPVVEWCRAFAEKHGRKPEVLDFAAGVASSLLYLERVGLADVTAVDALGGELADLRRLHSIELPVEAKFGVGEFIDEQLDGRRFDLVYVRNALDHNQCPALTWINLFKLVRVGGLLFHSHAIREATQENWEQLHQFDLFPKGDSLWIEDRHHRPFSLTDGLPLEPHRCENFEDTPKPWFIGGYVKLGEEIESSEFLLNAMEQLRRAFERRSRWAFDLESLVMREAVLRDPTLRGVPIDVNLNRA